MFSPDPGSWFLPIPDLGSKNSYKRKGCGSGSVVGPDPEPYWIRIGIQPEMRIRASLTCDMLRPIVSWKTLIMMSKTDVLVLFADSQESQIFLWPTVQSACIRTPAPIWTGFMLSSQIRASQAVFRHVLWKIQQVKQCTAHLGTAYLGTVQRGTLRYGTLGYGTLGYGTLGLRHTWYSDLWWLKQVSRFAKQ
jgi:hypothetical protein